MELASEKPRVIGDLNDLDKLSIGRLSREDQPSSSELVFEARVELIAMAMSLADVRRPVDLPGKRAFLEMTRISAKPHRASKRLDPDQISQFEDHRLRRVVIKLGRVRPFDPADVSRKLDRSA